MIKDRGIKKFQGFFMPEHISMLKKMERDYYKISRPHLDESKIEEMEQLILNSFENKLLIEITTWKDGFFTSRIGTVRKIDPVNKKIFLHDELESVIKIDFSHITDVFQV